MLGRTRSAVPDRLRVTSRLRKRRQRFVVTLALLGLLLCAGGLYELNQPRLRIAHVDIYGAPQSYAAIVYRAMEGKYLGLIPRDSIFFFPASRIRRDMMEVEPTIAAVSFFRKGLTGLSVKVSDRVAIAKWCGLNPTPGVIPYCYVFDANGVIFAPVTQEKVSTSTIETITPFVLYAPLEGSVEEPMNATIAHADKLPSTFDVARQLGTYGSPVTSIVLEGDEVTQELANGTRVLYVLGTEENAYTALVSSKENINLADGSIDYVDLRFDGKVYVKRNQ